MNFKSINKASIVLFLLLGMMLLPNISSAQLTVMNAELRVDWVNENSFDLDAFVVFHFEQGLPVQADLIPNGGFTIWTTINPIIDDRIATRVEFFWDEGMVSWDKASPFNVDVELGQGLVELEIMPQP